MPVADFRFAQPPAEIGLPVVHPAGEIDQPGEIILQLHVQGLQLLLVILHPFLVAFELADDFLDFFLVSLIDPAGVLQVDQALVAVLETGGQLGDVPQDGAQEGERGIGLGQRIIPSLDFVFNRHGLSNQCQAGAECVAGLLTVFRFWKAMPVRWPRAWAAAVDRAAWSRPVRWPVSRLRPPWD